MQKEEESSVETLPLHSTHINTYSQIKSITSEEKTKHLY